MVGGEGPVQLDDVVAADGRVALTSSYTTAYKIIGSRADTILVQMGRSWATHVLSQEASLDPHGIRPTKCVPSFFGHN